MTELNLDNMEKMNWNHGLYVRILTNCGEPLAHVYKYKCFPNQYEITEDFKLILKENKKDTGVVVIGQSVKKNDVKETKKDNEDKPKEEKKEVKEYSDDEKKAEYRKILKESNIKFFPGAKLEKLEQLCLENKLI